MNQDVRSNKSILDNNRRGGALQTNASYEGSFSGPVLSLVYCNIKSCFQKSQQQKGHELSVNQRWTVIEEVIHFEYELGRSVDLWDLYVSRRFTNAEINWLKEGWLSERQKVLV